MTGQKRGKVILLISCPDRKGIVAGVANFILSRGGNILQSDQYTTDASGGTFFLRVEFDLSDRSFDRTELEKAFEGFASEFGMDWRIKYAEDTKRMAIMVSRQGHCLVDLLWRWKTGELPVEIPLVVSNHPDLKETVEGFGIEYHSVPITPETKRAQEDRILALFRDRVDFIVLARYMQILTGAFLAPYPGAVINIHHSFLPAFVGGKPYEQALARGVKVIGATAHYVTEQLDEGPIVEQDVTRITHRDNLEDLVRKGKDLEKTVLARAVRWHVEDRILVFRNRTVVFS